MALFGLIALYDLATGAFLLLSAEPWRAHGPDTLWSELAASGPPVESLFRRLGALQILAGAVTLGFLGLARREPRALDMMLGLYAVAGLALAWTDHTFFAGTAYALVKQGLGALCAVAMASWAVARWRGRRTGDQHC